jgi:hypothetical protein
LVISGWIIFVFHGFLPSISKNASDFFAQIGALAVRTECRLPFCGTRIAALRAAHRTRPRPRSLRHWGEPTCDRSATPFHLVSDGPYLGLGRVATYTRRIAMLSGSKLPVANVAPTSALPLKADARTDIH